MDTKNNSEEKKVYIPKCPTCGSPDIRHLSSSETNLDLSSNRKLHANLVCKTFICNNCGYAW